MSFMMFPPEINSGLMYNGAGSGPLMAAASAWDELAADLEATATSYQTVIEQLTGTTWLGPSSARMAAASAPFVNWLAVSAGQAAATGAQAKLAAAAYEGAFTATVLAEMARERAVDMPISFAVAALLDGKMSVDAAIESLLSRPLKAEE